MAHQFTGIKLKPGDEVLAYDLVDDVGAGVQVTTSRGREVTVSPRRYGGSRAGRGKAVMKRGGFQDWSPELERLDLAFSSGEE